MSPAARNAAWTLGAVGIAVSTPVSPSVAATGVSAVSIDSAVPAAWAAERLQPRAAVQGNLDPVFLLAGGAALRRAAADVVARLGRGPMIFNLGHGVIKETPPEHVAELVAAVRGGAGR